MVNPARAQTWALTGADTNLQWNAIACSADGARLAATVFAGGIYISTNAGGTWCLSGAPSTNTYWGRIVSSADGMKLAVTDPYDGLVYGSADGGTTWTSNYVSGLPLISLASSADGTRLIAGSESDALYISTNTGITWSRTNLPVSPFGISVASSTDGTRLAAANEAIFTSTNSGATWQMSGAPTNEYWKSIASSADGTKLAAGGYSSVFGISQDGVFVSPDGGATWTTNGLPLPGYMPFVASSADGTTLMAVATDLSVARDGVIFTSTNSGKTWIKAMAPDAAWGGVACSADGSKLFAAAHPSPIGLLDGNQIGGIYTLQITNYPTLSLTRSAGRLVISWRPFSPNLILQQNTNLGPDGWTDVPLPPMPNLAGFIPKILVSPTNARTFYRLKSP